LPTVHFAEPPPSSGVPPEEVPPDEVPPEDVPPDEDAPDEDAPDDDNEASPPASGLGIAASDASSPHACVRRLVIPARAATAIQGVKRMD
jgi:protein TonB